MVDCFVVLAVVVAASFAPLPVADAFRTSAGHAYLPPLEVVGPAPDCVQIIVQDRKKNRPKVIR